MVLAIVGLYATLAVCSLVNYEDMLPYFHAAGKAPPQKDQFLWFEELIHRHFNSEDYNAMMDFFTDRSEMALRYQELSPDKKSAEGNCQGLKGAMQYAEDTSVGEAMPFPGGPYSRHGFGFAQWLTDTIMAPISGGQASNPIPPILGGVALQQVLGALATVGAITLEIVPPMIPPPFWLLRPLPCMPMITGRNCLGSVLYPITMPDFVMAHLTDQGMEEHLTTFPQKYATMVGTTTERRYMMCARIYLGLQCAKLFPMCFIVIGQMSMTSFPVCFPLCIMAMLACPGFGFESIMSACTQISIPPFCSFSIFLKDRTIPPQYASFEESSGPGGEECRLASSLAMPYEPHIGATTERIVEEITKKPNEGVTIHEKTPGKFVVDVAASIDRVNVVPSCDCHLYCDKPEEVPDHCPTCQCESLLMQDVMHARQLEVNYDFKMQLNSVIQPLAA